MIRGMARIKLNRAEHAVRMFYRQQQTLNAHVESAKCSLLRATSANAAGHDVKTTCDSQHIQPEVADS